MNYSEKLKDPRWQKLRLEVFQRDNFTCQCCEAKDKELQVHHREYRFGEEPWEYDPCFLVTLCKSCHEKATQAVDLVRGEVEWPGFIDSIILMSKMMGTDFYEYSVAKIKDQYDLFMDGKWRDKR